MQTTAEIVEQLAEKVRQIEGARRLGACGHIPSGCRELDALLPDHGFRRGSLVEWLAPSGASGAALVALLVARQALAEGGAMVIVDSRGTFYPPAAAALGIELEKLIVVRPQHAADEVWAVDQVLRCVGVSAAMAWPGKWDDHTFRRLQLAAESSGALGLLLRAQLARSLPSWADVRLLIEPLASQVSAEGSAPRRMKIEVLRVRGGAGGGIVEVEIDERTGSLRQTMCSTSTTAGTLPVASQLAAAAFSRRSQRA